VSGSPCTCGPAASADTVIPERRFSVTVRIDPKIAAAIAAIG
jgi:hypothetical protein